MVGAPAFYYAFNSVLLEISNIILQASIVVKGSRNPTLQPLVMEAALALRSAGIVVDAVWRSREEGMIKMADRGSRDFHADDVSLDFDAMCLILEVYGEFDVDTFASASNSKGRLFFSKLDVPGSAGMDFFHQTLDRSLSYFCFPPPYLLVDALQHFRLYGASAVMVVPIWANSSFYSTFWVGYLVRFCFIFDLIIPARWKTCCRLCDELVPAATILCVWSSGLRERDEGQEGLLHCVHEGGLLRRLVMGLQAQRAIMLEGGMWGVQELNC